ncbi:MAG: A24 family peptidase [Pirellulales bacterium]
MDLWLNLSPTLQSVLLFLWGAFVGGQINRGIYRLAYDPRRIGPWSPPPPGVPSRRWYDRLPVVGWLSLRREAGVVGRGFWIRPLLIEVGFGAGLAALYAFETAGRLLPRQPAVAPPEVEMLLAQFFGHAILLALMTVATFIDFDEQTIPDAITVPGTLLGVGLAAALPVSGLPIPQGSGTGVQCVPLRLTSPLPWDESLDGTTGLLTAIACFAAWCYALVPKRWIGRRGLRRGVVYFVVGMWRSGWCGPLAALALAGATGLVAVWGGLGGEWWRSLLSSVVGLAAGGTLVWSFRAIFGLLLQEEAMGFGDVTLMAMIGAFLGWQATLIAFFLAPFAAVVIAVGQWLLTGRRDIAFGPYLCLATGFLIVRWDALWNRSAVGLFALGWLIPAFVAVCVLTLGPVVWLWRRLR